MSIKISLEGLDDVFNAVDDFKERQLQGFREGLEDAAQIVETDAKARCPVGKIAGGGLRESITHKTEDLAATIGTNSDHGIFVEFGTGSKGDSSVAHTSKERWTYFNPRVGHFVTTSGMEHRPFLVPALKNNKDNIICAIKSRMG